MRDGPQTVEAQEVFMNRRRIPRKVALAGATLTLLVCVLALLARKSPDGPAKDEVLAEAVTPGPSIVWMDWIRALALASDEGQQLSLVRFESEREVAQRYDGQKVYPLATHLAGQLNPTKPDRIWIGGRFTVLADLRRPFFKRWGQVKDTVDVNCTWGGDKDYLRLRALIPKREQEDPLTRLPVPSLTVLAVMPRSAKRAADGHYIGPLTDHDARALPEMAMLLASEPFAKMAARRAEQLLDSTNCWVAWLGLARLRELRQLRTEHFVRAVGSRVPDDPERIIRELWRMADLNETVRADLTEQVVRLGKTPRMQEELLQALVKLLREQLASPPRSTHPFDLPAIQKTAREFRETIKDDASSAAVVRQLDALIALK